jgi:hypothetical protein
MKDSERAGESMTAWQTFLGLFGPRNEEKQTVAPELTGGRRAQDASDGLPAEPMLRIETGLHGGQIRGIDTDAKNRFAVTASTRQRHNTFIGVVNRSVRAAEETCLHLLDAYSPTTEIMQCRSEPSSSSFW